MEKTNITINNTYFRTTLNYLLKMRSKGVIHSKNSSLYGHGLSCKLLTKIINEGDLLLGHEFHYETRQDANDANRE